MQRSSLRITLTPQWLPAHTRNGDIALMDHFVSQGYKAHQLIQLNRCRLYLQVITLTDIVSADGMCIIPDTFIGLMRKIGDSMGNLIYVLVVKIHQKLFNTC